MVRKAKQQIPPNVETLTTVLGGLGIHQWDVVIIGDGSGCSWQHNGIGWASVLIDRRAGSRHIFYGAANTGTVTIAEILPWLYPLLWYTGNQGTGKQRVAAAKQTNRPVQIHVLSDNTAVVRSGNCDASRKTYPLLWDLVEATQKHGMNIIFHSIPRDTIGLHIFMDFFSKQSRKMLNGVQNNTVKVMQKSFPGIPDDINVYDLNP